jgi:hypothetical protein
VHDADVPEPAEPEVNRRKVRVGLAMVSVVVVAAVVLFVIIDDPIGRAVMFAVALSGFIRAYLMTRSLREG